MRVNHIHLFIVCITFCHNRRLLPDKCVLLAGMLGCTWSVRFSRSIDKWKGKLWAMNTFRAISPLCNRSTWGIFWAVWPALRYINQLCLSWNIVNRFIFAISNYSEIFVRCSFKAVATACTRIWILISRIMRFAWFLTRDTLLYIIKANASSF